MMSKWKRVAALGLIGFTLGSLQMVAFADTTTFTNFRVGAGLPDPYTERTMKAGGGSYDNNFYVTITGMSPSDATLKTQSSMVLNAPYEEEIISKEVYVTANSRASGAYTKSALANRYYQMKTMFYNGSLNQVTVSGRYTP